MRAAVVGGSLGGLDRGAAAPRPRGRRRRLRALARRAGAARRGHRLPAGDAAATSSSGPASPSTGSASPPRTSATWPGAATSSTTSRTYRFSSWNTVYRQLLARFGPERYQLGDEVTGWVDGDDAVAVHLADRPPRRVDLLVCADGIGSTARARAAAGRAAGLRRLRGVAGHGARGLAGPATRAALDDAITYYVYANSHILVYPIPGPDGSVAPGERLMNFVWYRNYLAGGDLDDVLTDGRSRREISLPPGAASEHHVAELRRSPRPRLPAPIARVVRSAAQPFLQVIYDVEVPRMAFGRVCLIGDAAFVARPHAAAGTAKAAADAWALAEALDASRRCRRRAGRLGAGPARARAPAARADPAHRPPLAGRGHLAARRPRADLRPAGTGRMSDDARPGRAHGRGRPGAARLALRRAAAAGAWEFPADEERRRWFYTPTDHGGLTLGRCARRSSGSPCGCWRRASAGPGTSPPRPSWGSRTSSTSSKAGARRSGSERGRDPARYYLRVFGRPAPTRGRGASAATTSRSTTRWSTASCARSRRASSAPIPPVAAARAASAAAAGGVRGPRVRAAPLAERRAARRRGAVAGAARSTWSARTAPFSARATARCGWRRSGERVQRRAAGSPRARRRTPKRRRSGLPRPTSTRCASPRCRRACPRRR